MTATLLIVVPTLDSYLLLDKLLLSLKQQTFTDWRLLFVDGPSSALHRQWLTNICSADPRCNWQAQHPSEPGIFGAMNQGFSAALYSDWVLFWGSDDWAATKTVLSQAIELVSDFPLFSSPDLLVCNSRYVNSKGSLKRTSCFSKAARYSSSAYRRLLLTGATPPHQAVLFGPGARSHRSHYSQGFRLAGDLDYFLQISRWPDLIVDVVDLELVHMSHGGISSVQTKRRLLEVYLAYRRAFCFNWWFPFILRYIRRISSLLKSN